jgi:polyhydroxyalkanoate synthesis regulator phasin
MIDILKKTYLAGAGLAAKGWDEVESVSKEIVKKAKMSEKEGAKYLKDMKKRYDDTQKKTGTYIEKVVRDILKKMDIATSADIKALKRDIQQLKKAAGITGTTATPKKRAASTTARKTTGRAKPKKRTTTKAAKKPARSAASRKR